MGGGGVLSMGVLSAGEVFLGVLILRGMFLSHFEISGFS